MKYMLLCYDDERAWEREGPGAQRAAIDEAVTLTHELAEKDQYVMASPLHPQASAQLVQVRDGKRIVTDGPFAETREVLGGFYVIDVDDLDQAIAVASRHPGLHHGAVEIRPVMEIPGLPNG